MDNNIKFLEIIKYIIKYNKESIIFKKYCDENDFKNFKKKIKDFKSDDTNKKFLKKNGFKKQNEELFDQLKKYFKNLVEEESEEIEESVEVVEESEEVIEEPVKEEVLEESEEVIEEPVKVVEESVEKPVEESEEVMEEPVEKPVEESEEVVEEVVKEESEEVVKEESEENKISNDNEDVQVGVKVDVQVDVKVEDIERKNNFKNALKMFQDMNSPKDSKQNKDELKLEKIKKKFNSLLQDYKLILEKNSSINRKTQNDLLKFMIMTLLNMID